MNKDTVQIVQFNYKSGNSVLAPFWRLHYGNGQWSYFRLGAATLSEIKSKFPNLTLLYPFRLNVDEIESVWLHTQYEMDIPEKDAEKVAKWDKENE